MMYEPHDSAFPEPRRSGLATWLALAAFVGACLAVGYGGAALANDFPSVWYRSLERPSWSPPSWVFAPAWTTLYIMMGTAAWLVWKRRGFAGAPRALSLFGLQLLLNGLWTPLFFGLHAPGLALIDLIAMWVTVALTITAFAGLSRPAAWLMAPYLAWLTYAGALNLRIWQLN